MSTEISHRINDHVPEILTRWEKRVTELGILQHGLNIVNDLPVLHHIAKELVNSSSKSEERMHDEATDSMDCALKHAEARLKLLNYPLGDLILEFHILRKVLIDIIEEHGPISSEERKLISNWFEKMVKETAEEYSKTLIENQESFMLTMAHDLRTPISMIKMNTYMLKRQTAPVAAIERIEANVSVLERMLRELLDVSRTRAGKPIVLERHKVLLTELVRNFATDMEVIRGDRFELVLAENAVASVNADGIRRVLENLVVNALKYGSHTHRYKSYFCTTTTT